MKKACLWIIVIFFWGVNTQAEEISIKSRYISLGLFKNGLAVVKRAVSLPGPGTYRVDDAPEPVHGTFWIESETGVEARMTMQVVEVPAHRNAGTDFQNELAGKYALIHFKDGTIPPASGKVVAFEQTDDRKSGTGGSANDFLYRSAIQNSPAGRFLILESSTGRIYADVSMIAYLEVQDETGTAKERRPVLFLT